MWERVHKNTKYSEILFAAVLPLKRAKRTRTILCRGE